MDLRNEKGNLAGTEADYAYTGKIGQKHVTNERRKGKVIAYICAIILSAIGIFVLVEGLIITPDEDRFWGTIIGGLFWIAFALFLIWRVKHTQKKQQELEHIIRTQQEEQRRLKKQNDIID